MKRAILACLVAVSLLSCNGIAVAQIAGPSSAKVVQPDAQPKPVLVLIQYDPWAVVVGADEPMFALYEDGTAIYRRGAERYAAHLSQSELRVFLESLGASRLGERHRDISLSDSTDQPTTDIHVWTGSTYSRTSIYGSLRSPERRAALPGDVADIYEKLSAFEWQAEVAWLPATVEVMIWPYEYAPDESIRWPKSWPNTRHPDSRQRGDGYSLYVPAADYQALKAFLSTRRDRGAVLIDGKKWAVSVRFPFPGETRWMDVIEESSLPTPSP